MTNWDLSQVCKAGSAFKNQLYNSSHQQAKEEKSHDYRNKCRQSIRQKPIPICEKTLSKLGIKG